MKILSQAKKYGSQAFAATSLMVVSVASHATIAEDITAAKDAAVTNQGAIAGAVITVAAVTFGLGYLLSWLRK